MESGFSFWKKKIPGEHGWVQRFHVQRSTYDREKYGCRTAVQQAGDTGMEGNVEQRVGLGDKQVYNTETEKEEH